MKIAILKSDGTPVYIDTFVEPIRYDVNGFLTLFKTDQVYKFYQNADFKNSDRSRSDLDGYYREDKYLDYVSSFSFASNETTVAELVNEHKFNFNSIKAKVGESIVVKVVDYGMPYDVFYNQKEYTFNLESTADGQGVKNYRKNIYKDLTIVDYAIDIPPNATSVNIANTLSSPQGYFYAKNFGDNVINWTTTSDVDKIAFKRLATLIAFRINFLIEDVFPNLLNANDAAVVDATANTHSLDISYLPVMLQAVFLLKKSWGYYYSPNADPLLVHRTSFDAVFSSNPDIDEFNYYYIGLVTFYNRCYKLSERLVQMLDDTKLTYLFRALSVSVLSVFPFTIITKVLVALAKTGALTQNDEDLIVKLVTSIVVPNIDPFLDFLLGKDIDVTKTNYESFYNILSDARLTRIPFVNWVVSEQTYRKYFNFAVYNLWLQSKYNFQHFPPGTSGPRTNPNAYFNQNPDEFNAKNVLTFSSTDSGSNTNTPVTSRIRFTSNISGNKIVVNIINETLSYLYSDSADNIGLPTIDTNGKFFGSFHLFQPVALAGFIVNVDLSIPQKTTIPAFLFHYAQEYTELADFDAKVALAIELTSDVLLFYFTGGLTALADMEYLMEIPELGKGLLGGVPDAAQVLAWRGLGASSEVINMTGLVLTQVQNYLISTATNNHDKAILAKSQKFVLLLLMLTGGVSVLAQTQAVSLSNDILTLIDQGTNLTVPQGFLDVLSSIGVDRAAQISNFETKLDELFGPNVTNNVFDKYTQFTDSQKLAFWRDFHSMDQRTWQALNNVGGYSIDNWLSLYENNVAEANTVEFILNPNWTNRIITFYDSPQIRGVLESYAYSQKTALLDSTIGAITSDSVIFINLENTPRGIELAMNALFKTRLGLDVYEITDVEQILTVELNANEIETLIERNKLYDWIQTENDYPKNIINQILSKDDLRILINRYNNATDITDAKALADYEASNRLFTTMQISNNGVPVGDPIVKNFVSGKNPKVNRILNSFSNSLKNNFIDVSGPKFDAFVIKAFDKHQRFRSVDTELKFIFNFLENYYQLGDHFEITMESTLFTCTSCQRYLQALQNFATADGKTIEIIYKSHPKAIQMTDVKLLIQ